MSMPTSTEMLSWIGDVVGHGVRRPGSEAVHRVEVWAAQRLREAGVQEVRLEPVELAGWRPNGASLRVWPAGRAGGLTEFRATPMPCTAPSAGTEAELTLESGGLAGRLAVAEVALPELPQSLMLPAATAAYDPENAFDELVQTIPFDPATYGILDTAISGGAAGVVGLLTGLPWDTLDYYFPYDAVARPIPGVWLSRSDGRELLSLMSTGPLTGRLTVDAATVHVRDHNVIGTLPGRGDRWIIIASHLDAPWASAVEDASGIAMVLAQARHWASVPVDERPHNLLFLLTAGHMAGAAGTGTFIAEHRDLLADVVLQLHLEHAARRCVVEAGRLVATDDPEVRWWFTSRLPQLERLVVEAVETHHLRRSLVLPPDIFGGMPPTDGAYFFREAVPLVHFLAAPMYLFDASDTIDKVDEPGLVPLSEAVAHIIRGTTGWPAGGRARTTAPPLPSPE